MMHAPQSQSCVKGVRWLCSVKPKRSPVLRKEWVIRRAYVADRLASPPRGLLTFAGEGKTTQILKPKLRERRAVVVFG